MKDDFFILIFVSIIIVTPLFSFGYCEHQEKMLQMQIDHEVKMKGLREVEGELNDLEGEMNE